MGKYIKFIVALILLFIIIVFTYSFSGHYEVTRTVHYGKIQELLNYDGILIFDEIVIKSERSGHVQYQYETGDRIRKGVKLIDSGSTIASNNRSSKIEYDFDEIQMADMIRDIEDVHIDDIKNLKNELVDKRYNKENSEVEEVSNSKYLETTSKYASKAGIFSSYSDQLENYYILENIDKIQFDKHSEMIDMRESGSIQKGDTIGRIINNYKLFLCFEISNEEKDIFKLNESKTIIVGEDKEIRGVVSQIIEKKNKFIVVMKFDEYIYNVVGLRQLPFSVLIDSAEGLLIPKSSVVEKDGKKGVYVENIDQTYSFKPINIKKEDEVSLVISENYFKEDEKLYRTVKIYDDVLIDGNDISHYKVR